VESHTHEVKPRTDWQSLRLLIDFSWWRSTLAVVWTFAPFCVVPAVFMALSGTVTNTAASVFVEPLKANPVELTQLLLAMGVLLLGLVLGLAFIVIGFGGWLFRLSAFSLALVETPSTKHLSTLSKEARKAAFKAAIAAIEPKKIHIGAVLLWATLYMLLPFFILIFCTGVKLISLPMVMGAAAIHIPVWLDLVCTALSIPNFLYLVIYSIVALIVAACSPLNPRQSAHLSFILTCRHMLPLSVISIVFTLLSCGIGAPNDLRQMMDAQTVLSNRDPILRVGSHVWQSLIAILLFPLTFTPYCDVLRPHLREGLRSEITVEAGAEST